MGGKYALLVGINYHQNPQAALQGCVNDTYIIRDIIVSKGFSEENIKMINDEDDQSPDPTGANVKKGLDWLCSNRSPDDVLLFHFSGHGTQVPDDDCPGQREEAIVLGDMFLLVDDDIKQFFSKIPRGCQTTFISDCCHSGGLLDHKSVVISGDKRNDPDVPDGGRREEYANVARQIPIDLVAQIMSQNLGADVSPTGAGINGGMAQLFGGSAGKLAMSYAVAALAGSAGGAGGAGGSGGGSQQSSIASFLSCCLSSPGGASAAGAGADPQGNPMAGLIASALGSVEGGNRLQNILAAGGAVGGHSNLVNMVEQAFQGSSSVTAQGAPAYSPNEVPLDEDVGILVTGCQSNETSADVRPPGGRPHGALTNAIQVTYNQNPSQSYRQLVYGVRRHLLQDGTAQNPTLECSERNADLPFLCY